MLFFSTQGRGGRSGAFILSQDFIISCIFCSFINQMQRLTQRQNSNVMALGHRFSCAIISALRVNLNLEVAVFESGLFLERSLKYLSSNSPGDWKIKGDHRAPLVCSNQSRVAFYRCIINITSLYVGSSTNNTFSGQLYLVVDS